MTMEPNKHDVEVCNDDNNKLPPLYAKYPWFVVQDLEDLTHQFFSTLHNPMFKYQCQISPLSGNRIRGCFHGWIILSNHPHNDNWSLWNPSSASNTIFLPPLSLKDEDYDSIRECCLSAPPSNPTSVLLLMISNKRTFVFCHVSPKRKKSLGEEPRWTEMSYNYQLKRITLDGHLLHSLTCCNGQIYALCSENDITPMVIRVEIVVKDGEVVIQLIAVVSAVPLPFRCLRRLYFLTGTCTELFLIVVAFRANADRIPGDVFLFKLDLARIDWNDLECLKNWDMSGLKEFNETAADYLDDLGIIEDLWEEVQDIKDTIFVVDVARDNLEYYNPAISSELGGYIQILDKMDKVIYSYHLINKTIVPSPMPFSVLPTSHMSMWECWSEVDHREAKFIVDSNQEEDELVINLISDNEVEVGESHLLDIPFDVLEMMMKFCVGVEYLNFRATSKLCHLAACMIQWRNHTSLMRLQEYSLGSPWLMVVDQIQGIITFTDPMLGDNYFMRCSQLPIDDETICCSRFGWLLFKTKELFPVFFNPFTNDLRELPKTRIEAINLWFSHPPNSPECMVVGFGSSKILILYVARETTWREVNIGTFARKYPICFPTFYGEGLYAIHKTGKLMVFRDLGKDNASWDLFNVQAPSCSFSQSQYFLVKCDQLLLLVVMGGFGASMEVFKLNEFTQEWEKVNGVGKHMIYICDTTCLCIEAKIPEMENKIFLAHLSSRNKKIVFYSLETCTFHTFNGTSIQEKFVDAFPIRHLSPHTWIEPSWLDSPRPQKKLLKSAPESCTMFS